MSSRSNPGVFTILVMVVMAAAAWLFFRDTTCTSSTEFVRVSVGGVVLALPQRLPIQFSQVDGPTLRTMTSSRDGRQWNEICQAESDPPFDVQSLAIFFVFRDGLTPPAIELDPAFDNIYQILLIPRDRTSPQMRTSLRSDDLRKYQFSTKPIEFGYEAYLELSFRQGISVRKALDHAIELLCTYQLRGVHGCQAAVPRP